MGRLNSYEIVGTETLTNTPIGTVAWNSNGTQLAYGGEAGILEIILAPDVQPPPPPSRRKRPTARTTARSISYANANLRYPFPRLWSGLPSRGVSTVW